MTNAKKRSKKGSHRKLNKDDRCKIERLIKQNFSNANIALAIGVHRSTITKELQRCGAEKDRSKYNAIIAQRLGEMKKISFLLFNYSMVILSIIGILFTVIIGIIYYLN